MFQMARKPKLTLCFKITCIGDQARQVVEVLGDRGDDVLGAAHLGEHLVQPLEGAVQVDLDPAGGRSHILSVILSAPTLDEGHPDGAHLGQLVDGLEPVVDGLREESGKLLVVEDLQTAAWRDLAHSGRVETEIRLS